MNWTNGSTIEMCRARVTYDTNVLISGFLFDGICEHLLRLGFSDKLHLFTSRPIIQEYQEKLRKKFERQEAFVQETTRLYLEFAEVVNVSANPRQITGNVVDNQVIETALVSRSHYLVTGDRKHLISLGKVDSTEIILPSDFVQIMNGSIAEA